MYSVYLFFFLFFFFFFFVTGVIETKNGGLLWAERHPPSKLCGNLFSSFSAFLAKLNFLGRGKNPSMLRCGGSLVLLYTDRKLCVNLLRRGKTERRQSEKCHYLCIMQQLNVEPVSNTLHRYVLKYQYFWQHLSVVLNDLTPPMMSWISSGINRVSIYLSRSVAVIRDVLSQHHCMTLLTE